MLVEATVENLTRIKHILSEFKNLSGLEYNVEKSVMMQVGNTEPLSDEIIEAGFLIKNKITILGITLTVGCLDYTDNALIMLNKVQKQINIWTRFNLSLSGRINIAKTMMYSQLNYAGCFLPIDDEILSEIEQKIVNYVTGETKTSREKIFAPTKEGGLGLFFNKGLLRGSKMCLGFKSKKYGRTVENRSQYIGKGQSRLHDRQCVR
jgi:hypothetical protein